MAVAVELRTKGGKKTKTKHGTWTAYDKHKCRCPKCGLAASDYQRERRLKRLEGLPPKPPRSPKHGTVYEYRKYRCRCAECKRAMAVKNSERTTKKGQVTCPAEPPLV